MPVLAGIGLLTGAKVVEASLAAKTVTLVSGAVISYEKLVVATGAEVRVRQHIWDVRVF